MTKLLKRLLKGVLLDTELADVFSSFDIIGDIAIIKIPDSISLKKKLIGDTLLSNVSNLKSVFLQKTAVDGEYRLRGLELIAGDNKYVTIYKEYGCQFFVNVASSYFSPRLSTERLRISNLVSENELIINMFGGIGTFSIVIAKKTPVLVYNIDSNMDAYVLSILNSKLNKIQDRIISLHGDAQKILHSVLFEDKADRILMPLPERAFEFIDVSVNCIKPSGGYLHFFSHIKSETKSKAVGDSENYVHSLFSRYDYQIKHTQIVRAVGPRVYQTVTDIYIKK
ncbi:MAG: class I SAM-dependent methyltransferase family protein [Nitrosopumilus sp.]|nr:class I SAM-dependent methyltransferase family protein [Nitrosopumilus sp.]